MFVAPAARADICPKRSLVGACDADRDLFGWIGGGALDHSVKNIADFNRAVVAITEKSERFDSGVRTDFVKHRRVAVAEEPLDGIECFGLQLLEDAEPECLRDGRVNAVENGVGAGALDPSGTAFGEEAAAGLGELRAGMRFGVLKTAGKSVIGEREHRGVMVQVGAGGNNAV